MKAKANQFVVAFLLHTFGVTKVASSLPSCSTDRPGWATHRTLYLPSSMVSEEATDDEISWTNVLCCVYTYVKTSDDVDKPEFELYDGSSYKIKKDTALEVMYEAYEDICDMSMGSKDCSNQAECIEDLLSPPEPVPPPTRAPSVAPVPPPTQAPVPPPTKAPVPPPTKAPVPPPTQAPIPPPTQAPVPPPTQDPIPQPTQALVTPTPTQAPISDPTTSPSTLGNLSSSTLEPTAQTIPINTIVEQIDDSIALSDSSKAAAPSFNLFPGFVLLFSLVSYLLFYL